jgi:bifunctional non-homologous end joining protein LigD
LSEKFPEIAIELQNLDDDCVLDGEVIVFNESGLPDFHLLSNYQSEHKGRLAYYLFDLLYDKGTNIENLVLLERKKRLEQIISRKSNYLKISEYINSSGIGFFEQIKKMGLEGMVAKKETSIYREGVRSSDWLKIKTHLQQEAVIGGFTSKKEGTISALLLGVHDEIGLRFIGGVGTGFNSHELVQLYEKLRPLAHNTTPFYNPPPLSAAVSWLKPELVCEVKFQEWTPERMLRQPVFLGLRDDLDPNSVRQERSRYV